MVEIYSYEVPAHERFARDQQASEAFRKQYHVPTTGGPRAYAAQAAILDFVPKPSAVDLLLQTNQRKMWARFAVPSKFYAQHFFRSPYIVPSLGPPEQQEADITRIETYLNALVQTDPATTPTQEEGQILLYLLDKGIKDTNTMVDFVIGRMKQFVPA